MALSNHHRTTIRKILDHPAGGNVEWREVHSLLEATENTRDRDFGDNRWGKPEE